MKNNITMVLLISFVGSVSAEVIDVAWDADKKFSYEGEITTGKFVEICDKLQQGQMLDWQFQSSDKLNFNIHYHDEKSVVFPAKKDGVNQLTGTLNVAVTQDYCWMWKNETSKPVRLTLQLHQK